VTDNPLRPNRTGSEAPGMASFEQQLALEHADGEPGRYVTDISDAWNCPIVPHGGVVTALAARAMELELGDADQPLRTITSVFAGQVKPGAADIDVTILRRGRSISQAMATLRNPGEDAGLTAVAVFGARKPGFEFTDLVPPVAPSPEECPSFRETPPDFERIFHFNFWDQADGRVAQGHFPWDDFDPVPNAERLLWYRFDHDPGPLTPLGALTFCDTMPGAVAERMGSGMPPWLPPSTDLTVHLLQEPRSRWVLGRNRVRHAGDGYASLEIELWDPEVGLVAYGTQIAFFAFPEGPPTPEQVRPRDLA
jgi:acyl-CoA thioesterase